jgi:hypothetical protein
VPSFDPLRYPTVFFTAGTSQTADVGGFLDIPNGNKNSTYTIRINWGDGTVNNPDITAGTATFVKGSYHEFKISGTKNYPRVRGLPKEYVISYSVRIPAIPSPVLVAEGCTAVVR